MPASLSNGADAEMSQKLVVFMLDEQRYGLRLPVVERVVGAVEVTPLPKSPEMVLGVINLQGRVIPVVNVRRRFRLQERAIGLKDHFIIARTSRRLVALVVDGVADVISCSEAQIVASGEILPGLEHVEGVLKLPDGMILLHDLDLFLSLDEEHALEAALQQEKAAP